MVALIRLEMRVPKYVASIGYSWTKQTFFNVWDVSPRLFYCMYVMHWRLMLWNLLIFSSADLRNMSCSSSLEHTASWCHYLTQGLVLMPRFRSVFELLWCNGSTYWYVQIYPYRASYHFHLRHKFLRVFKSLSVRALLELLLRVISWVSSCCIIIMQVHLSYYILVNNAHL